MWGTTWGGGSQETGEARQETGAPLILPSDPPCAGCRGGEQGTGYHTRYDRYQGRRTSSTLVPHPMCFPRLRPGTTSHLLGLPAGLHGGAAGEDEDGEEQGQQAARDDARHTQARKSQGAWVWKEV